MRPPWRHLSFTMLFKFPTLLSFILASLTIVNAGPISPAVIQANAAKGLRLLSLAEGAEPVWKTEGEMLDLLRAGKRFVRLHPATSWGHIFIFSLV